MAGGGGGEGEDVFYIAMWKKRINERWDKLMGSIYWDRIDKHLSKPQLEVIQLISY